MCTQDPHNITRDLCTQVCSILCIACTEFSKVLKIMLDSTVELERHFCSRSVTIMASSQAQGQRACGESIERSGTSVVFDTERQCMTHLNIKISRELTLTQEPTESLSLDYALWMSQLSYGTNDLQKYLQNLTLSFHNKVHEVSQDYVYEVEFKALIDNGNFHQHVSLCSYKTIRTLSSIGFTNHLCGLDPLHSRNCLIHICVHVVRFNKNAGINPEEHLSCDCSEILLANGFKSDVSLVVGDTVFLAHKQILSLKSNVFKAMFTHQMTENRDEIVNIKDFNSEVIEEMLLYIYTNKTKNLSHIYRQVFEVANLYEIKDLKSTCQEYFLFNMSYENVIDFLDLAKRHGLQDLRKSAMNFVHKYEKQMVQKESFHEFLCRNLSADTIAETLKLCVKYNMRRVKSRAFHFIRKNNHNVIANKEFLDLFQSHPDLMRSIYVYVCAKNKPKHKKR